MTEPVTVRTLSEDDVVLAGEAALGLLDRAGEATVAARVATDAAFAAEVNAWTERLAPLLVSAAEPPSAKVWNDVRARLGSVATRRPANGPVRLWQAIAGTATAVAATLAIMLVNPPAQAPVTPAQTLVATLGSETGRAAMTAAYDAQRGELVMTPVSLDTGARFAELWVIDGTGDAKSLGFVDANGATRVPVAQALRTRMKSGMTLAVTLENDNGAPHAKAEGPIVVSGKIEIL
jgi:anti-sigma-K factor RskA